MAETHGSITSWLEREPSHIQARYHDAMNSMEDVVAIQEAYSETLSIGATAVESTEEEPDIQQQATPTKYEHAVKQLELHLFGADPTIDSAQALTDFEVPAHGLLECLASPDEVSGNPTPYDPLFTADRTIIQRLEKMLYILASITAQPKDTAEVETQFADLLDWSKRYCQPEKWTPEAILHAARRWYVKQLL